MSDYYNARGYVLDGERFLNRGSAAQYLVDQFMDANEADSYLRQLVKQFRLRVAAC